MGSCNLGQPDLAGAHEDEVSGIRLCELRASRAEVRDRDTLVVDAYRC